MSTAKFKSGDLVMLKSGGPKMTVRKRDSFQQEIIECDWFEGHKHLKSAFHQDQLEEWEEEQNVPFLGE